MRPENRKQVRLILELRREEAEKRIADAVKALQADHAAKGCLRSGTTIKGHCDIITIEGQNFIKNTLDEISDVSMSTEAFLLFSETLTIFTDNLYREFHDNTVVQNLHNAPSVKQSSGLMLASIFGQFDRQKELRRFSFARPDKEERPALALPTLAQVVADSPPTPPKNKGGRPPAKFWDELWAEIAGQLYKGDFKPESQADITDAMLQWIEDKGYSAGDSTVAERARLLWKSIDSD